MKNNLKLMAIIFGIICLTSSVFADVSLLPNSSETLIIPVIGLIIIGTVILAIIVFVVKVIRKIKSQINSPKK
jgi:uncharacterized membrane-anchored protein